jgi:predicted DNA-binding transcriptional regulator YafY
MIKTDFTILEGVPIMKLDRLMGILTVLLQNDRVTAPYLAEQFEVNRRTIGRDIDALCQAGIPVVTYQGTGGGISIAEGFKLDKHVLTAGELSGIIAALKGIGSVSEKSQIERTLDKLGANSDAVVSLHEPIVIDLASHYKGDLTAKIETMKQAISENRIIEFDYFYDKGERHRRIEPYLVVFQWTSWYVFGFCLERKDWRMFKLNRLWDLSASDERFTVREIPPEKRDFNEQLTDDHKLVALFDKTAKYLLIEAYGFDCYQETDEGLYFEIGYSNRGYMLSWLLSFGDKVKVLEPSDIADEIRNIAKNILSLYL